MQPEWFCFAENLDSLPHFYNYYYSFETDLTGTRG